MAHLQESLSGVRIVTAHNRQRRNIAEHRTIVHALPPRQRRRPPTVGAAYGGFTETVGMAGQVVILVVGGRWVLDGTMEIGELVAFLLYLTAFFAPIQQLVQLYNTYQQGQASVRKMRDLLGEVPTVVDRAGRARPARAGRGGAARGRGVRVRPRAAGAARRRPGHPRRRDVRVRRGDRRRQVHHRQARQPPLRPHRGPGAPRRRRRA